MSLGLDVDPGPSGLAEAGAGLDLQDDCGAADLSAPVEALPPQPFSLSDRVRLHPGESLVIATLAGVVIGAFLGGLRGRMGSGSPVGGSGGSSGTGRG